MQGDQKKGHDFREMTVLAAAFAAGIPVGMWTDAFHIPTSYNSFFPTPSPSDGRSLVKAN